MASERNCRVGFIGCGHLMTTQHIQNAYKSDTLEVHTLCDINEERLDEIAALYKPKKKTKDYRELLGDAEVDLVVIAMDPSLHPKFALEALEAGKNVYVEKPLGDTIEEAVEVAQSAKEKGLYVALGFNRRFAPAYVDVKPLMSKREKSALVYYRLADHERGRRSKTNRIHVEACHIFDILHWMLDAEPVEVSAVSGGWHNDDIVTLKFDEGSVAVILSSGRAEIDLPKEHLEAIWDHQAVTVEDFVEARFFHVKDMPEVKRYQGRLYDGEVGDHPERFEKEGLEALLDVRRKCSAAWDAFEKGDTPPSEYFNLHVNYSPEKGWGLALEEMGRATIEGREPRNANALDAVRANVIAEAAMESIKTRAAVTLDRGKWKI